MKDMICYVFKKLQSENYFYNRKTRLVIKNKPRESQDVQCEVYVEARTWRVSTSEQPTLSCKDMF